MKRSDFLRLTTLGSAGLAIQGSGLLLMVERVSAAEPLDATSALRPYLQTPQPDSIWVSWWSDSDTQTFIDYGTTADALGQTVSGGMQDLGTNYHYHSGQLTGLQPGTYYYYRVRTERETSAVFRFRTPPSIGTKDRRFRVLVIGDNQIISENRWERIVERARTKIEAQYGVPLEEAIDFMLCVGDQVDVGTLEHYRHLHFAFSKLISPNIGFMTLIGNHETYYDTNMELYKKLFYYSHLSYQGIVSPGGELYYAHQQASILFIHLSSEHTGSTQQAWVQSVINAAKADAGVDLIVSLVHRPYQAEQYVGDISGWFRTSIMPILCQTEKHVLNIGAHHHLYARGQTREWPAYHIISGATAWDQYWGQSTETDFDDVQKTIANWAWQILDFDLPNRRMDVECYAEANVRLPSVSRWSYNNRLIDSFHRQLGLAVPETPRITNAFTGPVTLPLSLQSSPFSSAAGELLNSTQFQIAKDAAFANLRIDRIRDYENLYGDTGSPAYEPVDIHAGLDLLAYPLPADSLPNGTYHARVRHRDRNISWSAWSETVTFEVTGSIDGEPVMRFGKRIYAPNEDIPVDFEFGPRNPKDWIGIYKKGQSPGPTPSTTWAYLNGTTTAPATGIASGRITFTYNLAQRTEWYAAFMANDGYTELAPRVPFYVGNTPVITADKTAYAEGDAVRIAYTNPPGGASDWIGIYRVDQTPGGPTSLAWKYLNGTTTAPATGVTTPGELSFTGLPRGYYYATFMPNGGYFEISERVYFSVGSQISSCAMPDTTLIVGQDFDVTFATGPGTPKDYIGLFKAGAVPGVDILVSYLYVGGKTSGSVRFTEDIDPGDYWAALFINDSYTEVSNRVDFTIRPRPAFAIEESRIEGDDMVVAFSSEPDVVYHVEYSTDLEHWFPVRDTTGTGERMQIRIPISAEMQGRCFFRLSK